MISKGNLATGILKKRVFKKALYAELLSLKSGGSGGTFVLLVQLDLLRKWEERDTYSFVQLHSRLLLYVCCYSTTNE